MALPQARIVKQAGQLFAPPRALPGANTGQWKTQLRDAAAVAIGLWPLVAVMLLMVALLISAANWSSP